MSEWIPFDLKTYPHPAIEDAANGESPEVLVWAHGMAEIARLEFIDSSGDAHFRDRYANSWRRVEYWCAIPIPAKHEPVPVDQRGLAYPMMKCPTCAVWFNAEVYGEKCPRKACEKVSSS